MLCLTKILFVLAAFICSLLPSQAIENSPDWDLQKNPFPVVRHDDVIFQYRSAALNGNVSVADPFVWLEQPSNTSAEVEEFKKNQKSFFQSYLAKIPNIDSIRQSIEKASTYMQIGYPVAFGTPDKPLYLYEYKDGEAGKGQIYMATQKEIDEASNTNFAQLPGTIVFEEASLEPNYTIVGHANLSPDGTMFAIVVGISDYSESPSIYMKRVSDSTQEVEIIQHADMTINCWDGNSTGFFYTSYGKEWNVNGFIRYHKFGTELKEDILVVDLEQEGDNWKFDISDDRKYLLVYGHQKEGDNVRVYSASLDQPISSSMKWISIAPEAKSYLDYVTNLGNNFYFQNDEDAPNRNVVLFKLDYSKAKTVSKLIELTDKVPMVSIVVPEDKKGYFDMFTTFDNDKIVLSINKNARRNFLVYSLTEGKLLSALLEDVIATASSITSLPTSKDVYVWAWSYNMPDSLFLAKWNTTKNEFLTELIYDAKLNSIDLSKYEIEQRWTPSNDGTSIPFYLVYRKGLPVDGTRPVLLTFEGAFNYLDLPYYNGKLLAWIEHYDGVLISVNPRGNGDVTGKAWHEGGANANKQHTLDDIISVIEYSIKEKLTSAGNVILYGGSVPAPAILALANQLDEGILGAVLGWHGIYDLLRIDHSGLADEYMAEYGNPQDPQGFDWLIEWSPYNNINSSKIYPTIIIASQRDGEPPGSNWHSYKMIAQLQSKLANNSNPILLSLPSSSIDANNEEKVSQIFAIFAHVLGLKKIE